MKVKVPEGYIFVNYSMRKKLKTPLTCMKVTSIINGNTGYGWLPIRYRGKFLPDEFYYAIREEDYAEAIRSLRLKRK